MNAIHKASDSVYYVDTTAAIRWIIVINHTYSQFVQSRDSKYRTEYILRNHGKITNLMSKYIRYYH